MYDIVLLIPSNKYTYSDFYLRHFANGPNENVITKMSSLLIITQNLPQCFMITTNNTAVTKTLPILVLVQYIIYYLFQIRHSF